MNNATPTPNPAIAPIVSAVSAMVAFFLGTVAGTGPTPGTAPDRLDRIEAHAAETTARVVELERRVLALERPDRAVFAPGHPGRIGTAPGVEFSPNYLPGSAPPSPPALRGRGAGGEGPTAPPPRTTTDPNAIRDR